jgi:hypothetical protein
MGFDHTGYVEKLTSVPVARACEAIETTRKLLGSRKRWAKSAIVRKRGDHHAYCLHGALSRVLNPASIEKAIQGYGDEEAYVAGRYETYPQPWTLSPDNSPELNAAMAIGMVIRDDPTYSARIKPSILSEGSLAMTLYRFNDHYATTHADIKDVLKRAKQLCYDFAMAHGENGGF